MTTTVPAAQILDVTAFATAEVLLDALRPTDAAWSGPPSWIFRGQADYTIGLVPSAQRPGRLREYDMAGRALAAGATPLDVQFAEWTAIHEFIVAADRAGLSIPEDSQQLRSLQRVDGPLTGLKQDIIDQVLGGSPVWPPDNLLSVFALAQHYGVPTRLLDWTWKPLVAAYFACVGTATGKTSNPPANIAVWAIRPNFIETEWRRDEVGVRLVTAPQATNPNLHAQAGLMTVDSNIERPQSLEQAIIERVNARILPLPPACFPVIRKLTLPATESRRLLKLLAAHHVSAATVFPGRRGVVEALEERWSHR